jgi:hypothetical protein
LFKNNLSSILNLKYPEGAKNRKFRYALAMLSLKPQIFLVLMVSLILIACDRDNYTTWSCLSSADFKSTMVTKKAQMQFQDQQFDYCGSLGERSFFSKVCPSNILDSDFIFTPSTGSLQSKVQNFACTAL